MQPSNIRRVIVLIALIQAGACRADEVFLPQPGLNRQTALLDKAFSLDKAASASSTLAVPIGLSALQSSAAASSPTASNIAQLVQVGTDNYGLLTQHGDGNLAAVAQQGRGNIAIVNQSGRVH
jgi:hypothetical protein